MNSPFRHAAAIVAERPSRLRVAAFAMALVLPHLAAAADESASPPDSSVPRPPAQQLDTVQVTAKRLDAARNQLSPETGSTVYRFDKKDIQGLPFGEATPLNQLILQAPGAVQDSYGQLHVRGDHSNLQYRIDGVQIPEAISGFGQALDTRFADQINLLTGALPAQYGYRTAGIVDIHTRTGGLEHSGLTNGGSISGLGGSRGHGEGSVEYGGSGDGWNYYAIGSFLRDNAGIENPTASRDPVHDTTKQQKAFGYLSRVIDENSRVSLIVGTSNNHFQIPNVPGQTPDFAIVGNPPVDSAKLDARQNEKKRLPDRDLAGEPGRPRGLPAVGLPSLHRRRLSARSDR